MIKIHHCFSDGQGMIQSYHAALGALEQGIGIRDIQNKVDNNTSQNKRPGQREDKPTVWGTIQHAATWLVVSTSAAASRSCIKRSAHAPPGRLYCHSEGIDMDDIKMIRKAYGTEKLNLTLNDVAIAILARALRIASERVDPSRRHKDKRVAIFVPISVRPKGDWSLSNATTGSIAWLRFEKGSQARLRRAAGQVHREMAASKRSYGPKILFRVFNTFSKRRITYLPTTRSSASSTTAPSKSITSPPTSWSSQARQVLATTRRTATTCCRLRVPASRPWRSDDLVRE